jgi:hypothetical protein
MAQENIVTAAALLQSGKAVMIGEWRGYMPETINYTAKTGKAASFGRLNHSIEFGEGTSVQSIPVSQSVPDGTDPAGVVVPFKKGQRVLVVLDSMEVEKGKRSARSTGIHPA